MLLPNIPFTIKVKTQKFTKLRIFTGKNIVINFKIINLKIKITLIYIYISFYLSIYLSIYLSVIIIIIISLLPLFTIIFTNVYIYISFYLIFYILFYFILPFPLLIQFHGFHSRKSINNFHMTIIFK